MSTRYTREEILKVGKDNYVIFPFDALGNESDAHTLPYSHKILLENLLRHGRENYVTDDDIEALTQWDPAAEPSQEIAFVPSRVLLQDFTGVPAIVDLAVKRDAMVDLGGNAARINPLSPVDLVIDHSVMVDHFGSPEALARNTEIEIERNLERYQFLRWGQQAFDNFKVVPPGTGIVHQVNLEYLARVIFTAERDGRETFILPAIARGQNRVEALARREDGTELHFELEVRIDTPSEFSYFEHGGILQFVLRSLAS